MLNVREWGRWWVVSGKGEKTKFNLLGSAQHHQGQSYKLIEKRMSGLILVDFQSSIIILRTTFMWCLGFEIFSENELPCSSSSCPSTSHLLCRFTLNIRWYIPCYCREFTKTGSLFAHEVSGHLPWRWLQICWLFMSIIAGWNHFQLCGFHLDKIYL